MTAWWVALLPQVQLSIEGEAGLARALADAIQRLGCEVGDTGTAAYLPAEQPRTHIQLDCRCSSSPVVDPVVEGANPLFFHDHVRVSIAPDQQRVFIYDGRLRVELPLDGDSSLCTCSDGFVSDVTFVRTYVPVLLCLLLWLRGYHYVHGALLSLHGSGAVLVLGESGAGKSTTLLSLLKLGARWFTDDMAFVGPRGSAGSGLFGLPRDFHLTDDTLAGFPQLQPLVLSEPRFREKSGVRVSSLLPGMQREAPAPVAVVLLEPRGPAFRAAALHQSDIFLALLRSSAWGAVPGMPRVAEHHAALQDLTFRARGFRVSLRENSVGDARELLALLTGTPLAD